jgi:hypothetical protein
MDERPKPFIGKQLMPHFEKPLKAIEPDSLWRDPPPVRLWAQGGLILYLDGL